MSHKHQKVLRFTLVYFVGAIFFLTLDILYIYVVLSISDRKFTRTAHCCGAKLISNCFRYVVGHAFPKVCLACSYNITRWLIVRSCNPSDIFFGIFWNPLGFFKRRLMISGHKKLQKNRTK